MTMFDIWKSQEYQDRVIQLEQEGLTTSDAQGVADAEYLNLLTKKGGVK